MKKYTVLMLILFLAFPSLALVWAQDKQDSFQINACPKTKMQRDCLKCHVVGDFRVIETPHDAGRVYPTRSMKIVGDEGHFLLTDIDSSGVSDFFAYLGQHGIKKAIIEIHSPGGSLFDAQRIISLIQHWQSRGGTVETRVYGAAFSAGFYVFSAGDRRLVAKDADLMWHEIQSFDGFGFKVTTPSDKEEAARILRHLQDVRHQYLSMRGKLTKKEIDAKVSKKEWWMSGAEAVEYGFADGFLK